MNVLVGAEPIALADRERMASRCSRAHFTFALTPAEMLAAAPGAEVIFAKGIPREVLVARRSCAGCRPGRRGSTA